MHKPTASVVAGCGYTGTRLAVRLRAVGPTLAFNGSAQGAAAAITCGIDAHTINLDTAPVVAATPVNVLVDALGTPLVIYYLVPPAREGERDSRLERFLALLETTQLPASRIVYVSTTGVYGNTDGGVVDEKTPVQPLSARAKRRVAAEQTLSKWCAARTTELVIARVPGIYGPERLPIERILRRTPLICHEEAGVGNRIHVDDLVSALLLLGSSPHAGGQIFNVTDGNSISSTVYFEMVADMLGLPKPPLLSRAEVQATVSAETWSFMTESRQVSSARIQRELGFSPQYKDLRRGIRASV